jgi:hypothetical protein
MRFLEPRHREQRAKTTRRRARTETRRETVRQNGKAVRREVAVPRVEWNCDPGRERLIRYVTLEKRPLAQVRTGSYGSKATR